MQLWQHPRISVLFYRQQVGHDLTVVVHDHRHVRLVVGRTQTQFHQLTAVKVAAAGQSGQGSGVCVYGDFHGGKDTNYF